MKKNRLTKKGPFQVGVLGCMAERLKTELLEKEKCVDVGNLILYIFCFYQLLLFN